MKELKNRLIAIAMEKINGTDSSHDFTHALRVLKNAERIASCEGGDLEIIIPAALFHDIVVYPKNDPRSKFESDESAEVAKKILINVNEYSSDKIIRVMQVIREHSFRKGIKPKMIESKIIQDADKLEVTGAIGVMRTFSSTGQMKRKFYHDGDPFCKKRIPDSRRFGMDLFYDRLLIAKDRMNTKTAREIAEKRTEFLQGFLEQVREELFGITY